jgi:hypothetical protein
MDSSTRPANGDLVNYKIVAGVLGSLILVLVGVVDRLYNTYSSETNKQFREAAQRQEDRLANVEARQFELIEQHKYLSRAWQDQEERLRALERAYLQLERGLASEKRQR